MELQRTYRDVRILLSVSSPCLWLEARRQMTLVKTYSHYLPGQVKGFCNALHHELDQKLDFKGTKH